MKKKPYTGSVTVPKIYNIYEFNGKWMVSSNRPGGKVYSFGSKKDAEIFKIKIK